MPASNLDPGAYPKWIRYTAAHVVLFCFPLVLLALAFGASVPLSMNVVAGALSLRAFATITGQRILPTISLVRLNEMARSVRFPLKAPYAQSRRII